MNIRLDFLLILSFFVYGIRAERELKFVQAIWRHGDRAPLNFPYPKDEYTEKDWPRGWGQLTNIGMRQLHELGQFMRSRYPTFVSIAYNPHEVTMLSSESDRAIVSALSFYSGFYPATGNQQFLQDLPWQPIAVHTVGATVPDILLKPTGVKCAVYDKLVGESDEELSKEMGTNYTNLFRFLATETGYPSFAYAEVDRVYDINRELLNNLTANQPNWLNKTWPEYGNRDTMQIIGELRRQKMISLFDTPEKYKIMGGNTLYNFILNAVRVTNGTMNEPNKMMLYSSHDGTLLPLMNALEVSNGEMIPYASALIMEVYEENGTHTVELFYRNSSTVIPSPITIPKCGHPCYVEKLNTAFEGVYIKSYAEFQKICQLPPPKTSLTDNLSVPVTIILMTILRINW